jgi:hypothetical protein
MGKVTKNELFFIIKVSILMFIILFLMFHYIMGAPLIGDVVLSSITLLWYWFIMWVVRSAFENKD